MEKSKLHRNPLSLEVKMGTTLSYFDNFGKELDNGK